MSRLSEWFANTPVRSKILLGYGLILSFMILIALVVAIQADRIHTQNRQRNRIEALRVSSVEVSRAFASMTASLREYALTGDQRSLSSYEEHLRAKQTALRLAWDSASTGERAKPGSATLWRAHARQNMPGPSLKTASANLPSSWFAAQTCTD